MESKRIGAWTVIPEHLTVWVYEALSSGSLQKFFIWKTGLAAISFFSKISNAEVKEPD